jgi:hypothetical protein
MWGLQPRGHETQAVFAIPSLQYQQDQRHRRQIPAAAYRLTNTSRKKPKKGLLVLPTGVSVQVITSQITSPCKISNDSAYLFDEASNVLCMASAGTEEDAKLSPASVATLMTGQTSASSSASW